MQTLSIKPAISLCDHFDVPIDETSWKSVGQYCKLSGGFTPNRPKAPFRWQSALNPRTSTATQLSKTYGLYFLAAKVPYKALYVGIAAGDSQSSEGMLNRVKKHRVKLTASNVGSNSIDGSEFGSRNVGGVSHTGKWRHFATDRYTSFLDTGNTSDTCADVQIATGFSNTNDKLVLELFEAQIFHNQKNILNQLAEHFWLGEDNDDVFLLTTRARGLPLDFAAEFIFSEN